MKKLVIAFCLVLFSFKSLAYDCSNPGTKYQVLLGILGTYSCGTYEDPGTICYAQGQGTGGAGATGCTHAIGAPINGGLIFLVLAGAGLGVYMTMKKSQSETNLTA